ncbi:MAG: hypothetical protein MRJ68_14785 [Nitrospira sp.]|nr:hypothetical protein [Nitrospira sp.]
MSTKMRYEAIHDKLSLLELNAELDQVWADLQRDDSRVSTMARNAGIDLNEVRAHKRGDVISVQYGGAGLDPKTVEILIDILVNVGTAIFMRLVEKVIVPRIQEKMGRDVLKPRE